MSDDQPADETPTWGTTPPTPAPPQGWAAPQPPGWGTPPGGALPPPAPPPGWGQQPPPPPPPGWGQQPPPQGWGNAAPQGWAPSYVQQAPKPGVIPLRPLGVGELLDGAFTTIRRYPAATLGLSALVMLVVEAIQLLTTYYVLNGVNQHTINSFGQTEVSGDYLARLGTVDLVVQLVTITATVMLTGMLTVVVGQAVLGRPMGMRAAWDAARPMMWRLLGATLLIALIIFGIVVVGALPGLVILLIGIGAGSNVRVLGVVLMIIGAIGAGVYATYVGGTLSLTTPSLVLEKLPIRQAMRRSRILVKGSWWRIIGITLLAQLIAGVISGIIVVPFDLAGGIGNLFSTNSDITFTFTSLLLSGIGGLIASTLVRPFSAGVQALLYIDRRMRAEALDLTLQQAASTPQA